MASHNEGIEDWKKNLGSGNNEVMGTLHYGVMETNQEKSFQRSWIWQSQGKDNEQLEHHEIDDKAIGDLYRWIISHEMRGGKPEFRMLKRMLAQNRKPDFKKLPANTRITYSSLKIQKVYFYDFLKSEKIWAYFTKKGKREEMLSFSP